MEDKSREMPKKNTAELKDEDVETAAGGGTIFARQHTCLSCGQMTLEVGDFIGKDGRHYNRKCRHCGITFNVR